MFMVPLTPRSKKGYEMNQCSKKRTPARKAGAKVPLVTLKHRRSNKGYEMNAMFSSISFTIHNIKDVSLFVIAKNLDINTGTVSIITSIQFI